MHRLLPDWYQTIQVEARLGTFDALVRTAEERATAITADDLPEFVRLAYGLPPGDMAQRESFRMDLSKADAAIRMQQDWREVGVLAGVALMQIVESKEQAPLNRAAALLLMTARATAGESIPIPYFFDAARRRVRDMAIVERNEDRNLEATWLPKAEIPYPDTAVFGTDQAGWLENNVKSLRALAHRLSMISDRARRTFAAQAEVTDSLWWLLGGTSELTGLELAKVPESAAGFIIGHDLSRLSRYAVPFSSTRSLARQSLMTAGFEDQPVSLRDGAQAAVGYYREHAVSDEEWNLREMTTKAPDLLPVLASLSDSFGEKQQAPDLLLTPSRIAEQFALEVAACDAVEAIS